MGGDGDLAVDTALTPAGDGRFTASLSSAWEIWGPMGGYVAAVALRAAGEVSPFARPASFSCHYLGVAAFDTVDIEVVPLRQGRAATSHRVSIAQGGRPIMEALVWSVDEVDGLEHDESARPAVPPPSDLRSPQELAGDDAPPPFPFWLNFDTRPLEWHDPWPPQEPLPAVWRNWLRFLAWPPDPDPWLAAARLVLLADLPSWPSGHRPHAWKQPAFIAPTLDLQVTLYRLVPQEEWLLLEGTSPVAADGMIGFTSRVWTADGGLVASGGGQTLCRPVPPPT
jgi:acyl-CoA thioesterase-2